MKRNYVGWIYVEKESGYKDYFSVHVSGSPPLVYAVGCGERGAAAAVAFFEEAEVVVHYSGENATSAKLKGLGLGPVKLESTPLGFAGVPCGGPRCEVHRTGRMRYFIGGPKRRVAALLVAAAAAGAMWALLYGLCDVLGAACWG